MKRLILVEWRDSFADHGQTNLLSHDEDARWISVGWVVRMTDLFLTIITGMQVEGGDGSPQVDNALSIPWTQVVDWDYV